MSTRTERNCILFNGKVSTWISKCSMEQGQFNHTIHSCILVQTITNILSTHEPFENGRNLQALLSMLEVLRPSRIDWRPYTLNVCMHFLLQCFYAATCNGLFWTESPYSDLRWRFRSEHYFLLGSHSGHYFFVPWSIMTSQYVMMLLGMSIVMS